MMDKHWFWFLMDEHWFWLLLTVGCVVWYSTITIYVAIRGSMDIKEMLTSLGDKKANRKSQSEPGAS